MLEVILQIKAIINISLDPFSLTILRIGSNGPWIFWLRFRMYDPTTVVSIPTNPNGFGNSPSMIGEVINKKTGVKLTIGKVSERGASLTALMNRIVVSVLRTVDTRIAAQKVPLTGLKEWVAITKGVKINKAKNLCDHAADSTSIV